MTRAIRRAGASAATCSARTISTTSWIRGAASPNTPATSITSRRKTAGRPPTTSRRTRSISGVRTCRASSRSTSRRARAEASPVVLRCSARNAPSLEGPVSQRSFEARVLCTLAPQDDGDSLHHDLHALAGFEPILARQPVDHAERLECVVRHGHAFRQAVDRIVRANGDDGDAHRLDLRGLLQAHPAERRHRLSERAVGLRRALARRKDEAIDVAAVADHVEPERPAFAVGERGRRREAVDRAFLHAALVDVLHPARREVCAERLLRRHADDVEAQRLSAAVLQAEHGFGSVGEREACRRGEGEAELGMHEAAAAHEAFARIFAKDHAVERGEVVGAVALALRAGTAEMTRYEDGVLDAVGRRRMRREVVYEPRVVLVRAARLEVGVALLVGQKARGAVRIEAGALALAKSKLTMASFSRAQEFEADAIGVGISARG